MTEGGKRGWMCFCEEDGCNSAAKLNLTLGLLVQSLFFFVLANRKWRWKGKNGKNSEFGLKVLLKKNSYLGVLLSSCFPSTALRVESAGCQYCKDVGDENENLCLGVSRYQNLNWLLRLVCDLVTSQLWNVNCQKKLSYLRLVASDCVHVKYVQKRCSIQYWRNK